MMSNVLEYIEKEFGKNIAVTGKQFIEKKYQTLSVSPSLDFMLGGGIPEGSFCVFTGPPKVGKTTTALDFAGTCQKIPCVTKNGPIKRPVIFLNVEGRLKERDIRGINNLNYDELVIIKSEEGNILTAEKYMEMAEQIINNFVGAVVVVDSFSALCTEARRNANIGDRFRDDTPLLISNFCKRVSNVIPVNKTILIGITHQIANQGNGPALWLEASGRKLQYAVDVKMKATHSEAWKTSETQIGQKVHWECVTSAIGAPGIKMTSYLKYGFGLDKGAELAELCSSAGLIEKKGAWYIIDENTKVQGVAGVADLLNNNSDLYLKLYAELMTFLK